MRFHGRLVLMVLVSLFLGTPIRAQNLRLLGVTTALTMASTPLSEITSMGIILDLSRLAQTVEAQKPILQRGLELCRNVTDTVALASTCTTVSRAHPGTADPSNLILVGTRGVDFCTNGFQVRELAGAIWHAGMNGAASDQVLLAGEPKAASIAEVVDLARYADRDTVRNQLLIRGARLAQTPGDVAALQELSTDAATKDEILRRAFPSAEPRS